MKKWTRFALAFGLCLCLLVCGALAADAADIAVQLDGQNLTFTDAVPQVKDQRTFLPFRAVFEAMGAQVSNEGSVITATRGDKTLVMTLDQTTATVTDKGVTFPLNMDVAPYVDPATWRTYVPVRFAAQAFDCMVGWDQSAATAIIIDTEKLVDSAMASKSFTYLEKMSAMGEKYNTGIWNANMDINAKVGLMGMPITVSGSMVETIQDADKMSADANMKMDMSAMVQAMSALGAGEVTAEDRALLEAMKTKGMDMTLRGDMTSGKFYVNMDLTNLGATAANGFDPAAWYELDMAQLMAQSGSTMDWSQLLDTSKNASALDMVVSMLSTSLVPDNAASDYATIKAEVEKMLTAFSDQGFVAQDGKQVSSYTLAADNTTITAALSLTLDGDAAKSYTMGMDIFAQADGQTVSMGVRSSLDDAGHMDGNVTMDVAGLVSLDMDMKGTYTPSATAPDTTLPAGANVVPFTQLMGAAG